MGLLYNATGVAQLHKYNSGYEMRAAVAYAGVKVQAVGSYCISDGARAAGVLRVWGG